MSQLVKIKSIEHLTHDVLRLVAEKPKGITYTAGQAVDIAVQKEGWKDTLSCFTFTSLPTDDYIEFVIKTYPDRNRVTNQLLQAEVGDEIDIKDPFGDISYKGEGMFIAGGAGITPFLAILRELEKENKLGNNILIFANKKKEDIILEDYFNQLLGKDNFINILSDEELDGYHYGYVSKELIEKCTTANTKYYYLCGPGPMMKAVEEHLASMGVKEEFIVKEGL